MGIGVSPIRSSINSEDSKLCDVCYSGEGPLITLEGNGHHENCQPLLHFFCMQNYYANPNTTRDCLLCRGRVTHFTVEGLSKPIPHQHHSLPEVLSIVEEGDLQCFTDKWIASAHLDQAFIEALKRGRVEVAQFLLGHIVPEARGEWGYSKIYGTCPVIQQSLMMPLPNYSRPTICQDANVNAKSLQTGLLFWDFFCNHQIFDEANKQWMQMHLLASALRLGCDEMARSIFERSPLSDDYIDGLFRFPVIADISERVFEILPELKPRRSRGNFDNLFLQRFNAGTQENPARQETCILMIAAYIAWLDVPYEVMLNCLNTYSPSDQEEALIAFSVPFASLPKFQRLVQSICNTEEDLIRMWYRIIDYTFSTIETSAEGDRHMGYLNSITYLNSLCLVLREPLIEFWVRRTIEKHREQFRGDLSQIRFGETPVKDLPVERDRLERLVNNCKKLFSLGVEIALAKGWDAEFVRLTDNHPNQRSEAMQLALRLHRPDVVERMLRPGERCGAIRSAISMGYYQDAGKIVLNGVGRVPWRAAAIAVSCAAIGSFLRNNLIHK